jgi:hypothetical protein
MHTAPSYFYFVASLFRHVLSNMPTKHRVSELILLYEVERMAFVFFGCNVSIYLCKNHCLRIFPISFRMRLSSN